MSQATRNLQKKFFLTAWLQILTHLAVIVIPMGYTFFSFLLRYRNQILVNLSTIIITLHGIITSISSIAINRPFRNHVKSWLCPKRLRNRRSSTNLNVLTVSSSWF
ncbi:hypothetical protein L3Y34_017834 [Caenorhabditis briggsae]|nr:hypothetical protein L3Y34_017834 [Caenorhabditis briggsae]